MSGLGDILLIDASARRAGSVSRALGQRFVDAAQSAGAVGSVARRDVAAGLPFLDETWVQATFTPPEDRTEAQKAALALSDALVAELQAADTLVITSPIYNFGPPAALKAWIDLVARAGVTFRYTANGPEGLLTGKRAVLLFASGGVEAGSDSDFAARHLKFFLGFLGVTDVTVVAADQLGRDAERQQAAERRVDALVAEIAQPR